MPQYMLISHHPMDEAPPDDITPEMIQAIIEKYNFRQALDCACSDPERQFLERKLAGVTGK